MECSFLNNTRWLILLFIDYKVFSMIKIIRVWSRSAWIRNFFLDPDPELLKCYSHSRIWIHSMLAASTYLSYSTLRRFLDPVVIHISRILSRFSCRRIGVIRRALRRNTEGCVKMRWCVLKNIFVKMYFFKKFKMKVSN